MHAAALEAPFGVFDHWGAINMGDFGELSRRAALRGASVLTGGALVGPAALSGPAAGQPTGAGSVRVDEGTNICAVPCPDGTRIAFDLGAAVWTMPGTGGTATRLTDEITDASQPHWSPDGRTLVFQAYRDGNYHLWTCAADGSAPRRLTSGPFDHREPRFAPDGTSIAFCSDRAATGNYRIYTLELSDGSITERTRGGSEHGAPVWSPDGNRIAFTVNDAAIDVLDLRSGRVDRAVRPPDGARVYAPGFAPDGTTLAYVRFVTAPSPGPVPIVVRTELVAGDRVISEPDEDVFRLPVSWLSPDELLYTADGRIKRRRLDSGVTGVPFAARVPVSSGLPHRRKGPDTPEPARRQALGIASPVASRDGSRIAFRALGALWLVTTGDPKPRRLVADGYFNSDPDFTADGRALVYSSDRAGTADLWLHELDTGVRRRLSGLAGAQLTPRCCPDGERVAYADQDGATWVLNIANGWAEQVTPPLFLPGRPSWSADGNTIALAAVKPYAKRFREGTSQILTVHLPTGELTYTEPMAHASITTRGDDGPVWSPDGAHLAFVLDSMAWVVPVDAAGRFTGEPRQVSTEIADAPCWLGPDRLMYLHHGGLRMVPVAGGEPSDVPLSLGRQPAKVRERSVIRAGALWDGKSTRLRRDVDIVVERGRVAAVLPAEPGRAATVDARELTVLPGFIEAHNHWHLRGRQWGARQGRLWLAYGVTSTRSPGDPAYQLLETREALESGNAVGPRLYGSGEPLDGSRIYYSFMRPVRSYRQLEQELERAAALGYDMVKTYVRLPAGYQRRAVEVAHRAGVPLSSHYLCPGVGFGMDGMEHTGSTNRLGYSQTATELGRSYADTVTLFGRSGMSITPTLFHSYALYAEDDSLVTDRRSRVLFPDWEYRQLVGKAQVEPGSPALRTLTGHVDMLLRIHRAGGLVIAGTDAPLDNIAVSLHTNLRAMVRFGFTPVEALTTATGNTARWLGMPDRLGLVAPGACADLTFVAGDPLADIRAAANVRQTMVGGVLYTVDELLAPFAAPAGASAPADVRRAVPAAHQHDEPWWHASERAQPVCCGA